MGSLNCWFRSRYHAFDEQEQDHATHRGWGMGSKLKCPVRLMMAIEAMMGCSACWCRDCGHARSRRTLSSGMAMCRVTMRCQHFDDETGYLTLN